MAVRKLTFKEREQFNKWFNDGNAERVGVDKYKEQSTQWKKYFTIHELEQFYIKEYLRQQHN